MRIPGGNGPYPRPPGPARLVCPLAEEGAAGPWPGTSGDARSMEDGGDSHTIADPINARTRTLLLRNGGVRGKNSSDVSSRRSALGAAIITPPVHAPFGRTTQSPTRDLPGPVLRGLRPGLRRDCGYRHAFACEPAGCYYPPCLSLSRTGLNDGLRTMRGRGAEVLTPCVTY